MTCGMEGQFPLKCSENKRGSDAHMQVPFALYFPSLSLSPTHPPLFLSLLKPTIAVVPDRYFIGKLISENIRALGT